LRRQLYVDRLAACGHHPYFDQPDCTPVLIGEVSARLGRG
jgi:hypothetical protein